MPRSQKKTCRNFRVYFREYSEVTGIHGLRYIAEKRSFIEKIFWGLVLLVSLGCCVYMIDEIWTKYRTSPVVISFSNAHTPIYAIPFPAVTICPESKSSAKKFNFTDVYWRINDSKPVTDEELEIFAYMQPLCDAVDDKDLGNETIDEEFFKVIRQLQQEDPILNSCSWLGTEVECNTIFVPIMTDQGLCYSFNVLERNDLFNPNVYIDPEFSRSVPMPSNYNPEHGYPAKTYLGGFPYRAYLSGYENSLTVTLWQDGDNGDFLCRESSQGFRVHIHNPFTVARLNKDYFSVADNRQVVAVIRPNLVTTSENVKRFAQDKRHCFLHGERKLEYFKAYTQDNCYLECLTIYTLKECECVEFYMPRTNGTPICGNAKRNCLSSVSTFFKTLNIMTNLMGGGDNYCNCQPLCSDLKYHSETSQNVYNMKKILQAGRETELLETINSGILVSKVSIYFKEEQFTSLERHELYGITDLISNFGGVLGLFTGFSILSIVEIFYFLTLRIFCNSRLYGLWTGPQ